MAGKIATAAQNTALAEKQASTPLQRLKGLLDTDEMKKRLSETLKENAGAFSASIIELFTSDNLIKQCSPDLVIAECLKGASLKLPINKQLGFAYVVPFKNNKEGGRYEPQFQLGYKGYIQLAMRTGAYKCINTDIVYEGELVSKDKLTGNIDLTGERTSNNIIGYFAHFETVNGFSKTLYMSKDEVLSHAQKRSKTFYNGKFSGPWATDFDAMAQKTCIRLLLSKYGIMSVEMSQAVTVDEYSASDIKMPSDDYIIDVDENGAPDVDKVTGEVIVNA